MRHAVTIRQHSFVVDEPVANGGEDAGPTPHELYDSALGACKAMTVLWYAGRKGIALEGVEARVERDDSEERQGVYRLVVTLKLTGSMTDEQRQELLNVASKCPVHRLMAQARTEIRTELAA
jgi:putative redox protein